jgi:hypothetical protein
VAATNFVGNGSGLIGVAAATANTANFATTAATAMNALSLGNVAAANYARLDIGNNLTGNQAITGNLSSTGSATLGGPVKIGGGTPIIEHLSLTHSLNVAALNALTCAPLQTFTLTGASDGDSLALGVPNSLVNPTATGAGILNYSAWVSSANTITIRVCNLNPSGPKSNAVSGTIRIDLWKH